MYYTRKVDDILQNWKKMDLRKPILLRGARQVGKSSAVRELAKQFEYFVEVNFEAHQEIHAFFKGNLEPKEICENLALYFGTPIIPGKTLLFFDEIQNCIPAITSLRYFYEKYAELHLVAAGSLLEFALEQIPSFGVGRIRSIFLYPFSFDEFLVSQNQQGLVQLKMKASDKNTLELPFHDKLIGYLKKFLIVGGMPEAVATYAQTNDILKVQEVLDDLLISLRADFTKYKKRVPTARISNVFDSVINQTGGKFIFNKVATDTSTLQVKETLNLLEMAGLIFSVTHTAANGLPLGAEINEKRRKYILFDTGLFQRILGLNPAKLMLSTDFETINKGAIAEMFVGLEWLKCGNATQMEQLYYWHRESTNSSAEIDYVFQNNSDPLPIEIKASNKGAMQSLHQFVKEKNSKYGIRISLENFSAFNYVLVFPLYAISTLRQFCNSI
jgi:uncharacterized protein